MRLRHAKFDGLIRSGGMSAHRAARPAVGLARGSTQPTRGGIADIIADVIVGRNRRLGRVLHETQHLIARPPLRGA